MSDKLTRQSTLGFDHFTKTSRNHTYDISAEKEKKEKNVLGDVLMKWLELFHLMTSLRINNGLFNWCKTLQVLLSVIFLNIIHVCDTLMDMNICPGGNKQVVHLWCTVPWLSQSCKTAGTWKKTTNKQKAHTVSCFFCLFVFCAVAVFLKHNTHTHIDIYTQKEKNLLKAY